MKNEEVRRRTDAMRELDGVTTLNERVKKDDCA